jgi:hypothetical protein
MQLVISRGAVRCISTICLGLTCVAFSDLTAGGQAAREGVGTADFDGLRPPLAFRAEWKRQTVPQHPILQQDLIDQRLELKLYGDGKGILWTQHAREPTYAWTGLCETNCAVAYRDKDNYIDMTGQARIRWRSMQAGFHLLRPIVKLADGTWLAADHVDAVTDDWKETDIPLADLRWRRLDMNRVVEAADGKWVYAPDLSRVDEIGFTDLMVGAGHGKGGVSRVAWVEVYGKPVARPVKSR